MRLQTVGFALCGSFCTFEPVLAAMSAVAGEYETVVPILSRAAAGTDSRFGAAADFRRRIEAICGRPVIDTVAGAEPIGPRKLLDLLIIAPCTGNTLAKLNAGIADTAPTMAAKAHLRGGRPVLLALSTNDALSGAAKNIGTLLDRKHVYFVPFRQDAPESKPRSCTADLTLVGAAAEAALDGRQLQPILLAPAGRDAV